MKSRWGFFVVLAAPILALDLLFGALAAVDRPAADRVGRAESMPECPYCADGTRADRRQIDEWIDPRPYFRDNCGALHTHDGSYYREEYSCPNGDVWVVAREPDRCACGWPDYPDGPFEDECPPSDGAYVFSDRP